MSLPSLQHRLSISVIIASHVLEQTHQPMFPILVFLRGQLSWGLLCLSSSSFKRFSTSARVLSGSNIYGNKPNSSLPSEELEHLYPSCDFFKIYQYIKITLPEIFSQCVCLFFCKIKLPAFHLLISFIRNVVKNDVKYFFSTFIWKRVSLHYILLLLT